MDHKRVVFGLLFLLLFGMSGCQQEAGVGPLDGTWKGSCGFSGGDYYVNSWTFMGSSVEGLVEFYDDANCATSPNSQNRFQYQFNFGASGVLADGAEYQEVDATTKAAFKTVFTAAKVDQYNTYMWCGVADWVAGVEKNVSSLGSCAISQVTYMGIYHLRTPTELEFSSWSSTERSLVLNGVVYTKQ